MRKVCLSGCFKRKMGSLRTNIWQFAIAMGGIIIGAIVLFGILFGTGYVLSFVFTELEPKNFMPTGMLFYVSLGVTWWILWLIYKVYKYFTTRTFQLVKEKYENGGPIDTCSIFEYCDEVDEKEEE